MYNTPYPRCVYLREMYVAVDGQCMPCCDLSLGIGGNAWTQFYKKEWHLDYFDINDIIKDMHVFTGHINNSKLSPIEKCSKTCTKKDSNRRKYFHLELSTRCTLQCPKCPRTRWQENSPDNLFKKTDMKYEHVEQLVKANMHNEFLLQGTLGDPVFHPRLFEIINLIDKNKKSFIMSTASPSRNIKWWEEFYDSYSNDNSIVRFGVDGLADTAHMYRIGMDFDKVWQAMLLGSKLGKNIQWQFIPFKFNERQIEEAQKMAKDNGITFKMFKSDRWDGKKDPLRPKNKNLFSMPRKY
jgi:MoaA/NifB/PqqE/SkfB family radical SAM enzyme